MPTKIEWCDETWNPVTGCSERCKWCYAHAMAKRLKAMGIPAYQHDDPFHPTFHPNRLEKPLRGKKPRTIFVCSIGELFDPKVPFTWQDDVFYTISKYRL